MEDSKIIDVLSCDLSIGTDRFRDDLLRRCLEVLDQQGSVPLSDEELSLLAAASGAVPLDTDAGMEVDGWAQPRSNSFWTPTE